MDSEDITKHNLIIQLFDPRIEYGNDMKEKIVELRNTDRYLILH